MQTTARFRTLDLLLLLTLSAPLLAAELFVSPHGDDSNDGLSEAHALQTLKSAVAKLAPGDTLTALPGDYHEALRLQISGVEGKPITIRAKRPGTVLLRGDIDVTGFEPVPGLHYTWCVPVEQAVEGVGERDTAAIYAFVPSAVEVEDVRGSCYYDLDGRTLYIHTSDSRPPSGHAMIASVTNDFGMLLEHPRGQERVTDIVVDGIGFSGYVNREVATRPGGLTRWGLYFVLPERCVVRRCTAFLNGGGIGYVRPIDCLIEDCLAFGNHSTYSSSGGNIIAWSPATRTILRHNVVHSTPSNGIRFYGGGTEDCVMEGNLAYDCGYGEIWIKGGANATSKMLRNISLGALHPLGLDAANIRGNICKYGSGQERFDSSSIILSKLRQTTLDEQLADPVHHDYRVQSDSQLRGKGPDGADPGPFAYRDEVFFVSPDGDDTNPGTCLKQAWRTLQHAAKLAQPGHTVYVLAGKYSGPLAPANSGTVDQPIVFKRRGHGRVELQKTLDDMVMLQLDGRSHVHVIGLDVPEATAPAVSASDSDGVVIEKCHLSAKPLSVQAEGARSLAVRHCSIDGWGTGVKLRNCPDAELVGNMFSPAVKAALDMDTSTRKTLYSDFNCIRPTAQMAVIDDQPVGNLEAWQKLSGQDMRSRTLVLGILDVRKMRDLFVSTLPGLGPLATNIGPGEAQRSQASLRLERVSVHAVSATTANIEWWTPTAETTTTVHWGTTRDCPNTIETLFDGCIFHTVSLIGLQPDTTYYFRVSATKPVWEFHTNEALAELERAKERERIQGDSSTFRTLAQDAEPVEYHVSVDGDDARDGLTADTAWRTLRHAAASIRAGDTVTIHAGTYEEHVPVRVSGDQGRPVTFRAAPGEKVWMNGSGQKRSCAFRIASKHHVVLDGLYFHHFRSKPYNASDTGGAVHVVGGSHNVARRCFYDGRTKTYMPFFIHALDTSDFLMENCVVIMGWNNVSFWRCPNLLLRNNVVYNGQIRALNLFNDAAQTVTLSHNLICANIPQKVGNAQVQLWHLESYRGDHNCFFSRKSADARKLVDYVRVGGEKNPGTLLLAELRERTGQDQHTIFANPGFAAVKELKLSYETGEHDRVELHRSGMEIEPLDFADFLADPAGPCGRAADGKPIGLDPAAF